MYNYLFVLSEHFGQGNATNFVVLFEDNIA